MSSLVSGDIKAAQAKIIHDKTEKVEAVNPYLVRIHFKEPFPDFLEYLSARGNHDWAGWCRKSM